MENPEAPSRCTLAETGLLLLEARADYPGSAKSNDTESANTLMIPHLQVLTQRKQRKQRKAWISQAVLCFLCVPSLFADSV
jgi:hypothetical protein